MDPIALSTYVLNLHGDLTKTEQQRLARSRDLFTLSPGRAARDMRLPSVTDSVDVILAGLPCQAFARIGRSKLGSIAEDPDAYRKDPRAGLYRRFLTYVRAFKPLAIVLENVPDILNHGGHNVPEEISRTLTAWGYRCRYSLLNAANYGVPQLRERLFLIALHDSLDSDPAFPAPTHQATIPTGYGNARQCALKHVDIAQSHYAAPPTATSGLPPAVTVREALADLPPINRGEWSEKEPRPSRNISDVSEYVQKAAGFPRIMRNWKGFAAGDLVGAHVARHTPRDYRLFRQMLPGEQYPEMHRRASAQFNAEIRRCRAAGEDIAEGGRAWNLVKKKMVPPYDPGKFPNKWRKLEPDRSSCTVTAHVGKDTYSHIHYDSAQARTISVREAARLQSFPDAYMFSGAMNAAFRQIGNAVPPLMARALACTLAASLGVRERANYATTQVARFRSSGMMLSAPGGNSVPAFPPHARLTVTNTMLEK